VERSDASEETRGKPQAKETHGELQAAAPCQGHELQSANDRLWQLIRTGSKQSGRYNTKVAIDFIRLRAAVAKSLLLFFCSIVAWIVVRAYSASRPFWVTDICNAAMSALPPIADMCGAKTNVRFGPTADIHRASPVTCWNCGKGRQPI
jgi:hypothetical protein